MSLIRQIAHVSQYVDNTQMLPPSQVGNPHDTDLSEIHGYHMSFNYRPKHTEYNRGTQLRAKPGKITGHPW